MPRARSRLSARFVQTVTVPGRYADGGGLYLLVDQAGNRRWLYRYTRNKRTRDMGLGPARDVSLARARELAEDARRATREGIDPIEVRPTAQRQAVTFREAAEAYIAAHAPGWRNPKHVAQWRTTLLEQAAAIGRLPVDKVDTEAVLMVLRPIWLATPETASRLRGRIERVLDAAKAAGDRSGENPARWRGHLDHLLPRSRPGRTHHAALPWPEAPALLIRLRALRSISAAALEWTILTAARTGETIGATWAEIDFEARVWTVPASRMKAGREHRVPLCRRCMAIAAGMRQMGSPYVFPGGRTGRPLSNMAMAETLKHLAPGITVHGFRSTFRDWAGDRTNMSREVIEAALAHRVGDATELAYRRQDALEKRRRLMDAWAAFLDAEAAAKIVRLG